MSLYTKGGVGVNSRGDEMEENPKTENPKTENPKTRVQTQLRTRDTRLDRCCIPFTSYHARTSAGLNRSEAPTLLQKANCKG